MLIPLPSLCYSCPPIHLQHKSGKKKIDFHVWAVDLQIGDVHSGDEWSQVILLCKSRIIAYI